MMFINHEIEGAALHLVRIAMVNGAQSFKTAVRSQSSEKYCGQCQIRERRIRCIALFVRSWPPSTVTGEFSTIK